MRIFISHDFDDKADFDNIADALEDEGIPYFNPYAMLAGRSLPEMLRKGISESSVCIFIATRNSVASAWCGAELGAFWGAGKRVIIYMSDRSLQEEDLPKQFKQDLRETRIKKLIAAAKEYLESADVDKHSKPPTLSDRVGDMTRLELQELIEGAINLSQTEATTSLVVGELASLIPNHAESKELSDTKREELRGTLSRLLGLPETTVRKAATAGEWFFQLSLSTTTGEWIGFALEEKDAGPGGDWTVYIRCLLLRFDDQHRVAAAAALSHLLDKQWAGGGWDLTEPIEIIGRGQLGEVV